MAVLADELGPRPAQGMIPGLLLDVGVRGKARPISERPAWPDLGTAHGPARSGSARRRSGSIRHNAGGQTGPIVNDPTTTQQRSGRLGSPGDRSAGSADGPSRSGTAGGRSGPTRERARSIWNGSARSGTAGRRPGPTPGGFGRSGTGPPRSRTAGRRSGPTPGDFGSIRERSGDEPGPIWNGRATVWPAPGRVRLDPGTIRRRARANPERPGDGLARPGNGLGSIRERPARLVSSPVRPGRPSGAGCPASGRPAEHPGP